MYPGIDPVKCVLIPMAQTMSLVHYNDVLPIRKKKERVESSGEPLTGDYFGNGGKIRYPRAVREETGTTFPSRSINSTGNDTNIRRVSRQNSY